MQDIAFRGNLRFALQSIAESNVMKQNKNPNSFPDRRQMNSGFPMTKTRFIFFSYRTYLSSCVRLMIQSSQLSSAMSEQDAWHEIVSPVSGWGKTMEEA